MQVRQQRLYASGPLLQAWHVNKNSDAVGDSVKATAPVRHATEVVPAAAAKYRRVQRLVPQASHHGHNQATSSSGRSPLLESVRSQLQVPSEAQPQPAACLVWPLQCFPEVLEALSERRATCLTRWGIVQHHQVATVGQRKSEGNAQAFPPAARPVLALSPPSFHCTPATTQGPHSTHTAEALVGCDPSSQ